MAMCPAIAEHVLGAVVRGSLDGKLQAVTGSPNVRHMMALRGNCSFAHEIFSSGWLLDPGVWMMLKQACGAELSCQEEAQANVASV
jgi:hypothetical protein